MKVFFYLMKCPAADATDAPQPSGLLCNCDEHEDDEVFSAFPFNGAPVG
jgi:hypothetical protein